MARSIKKQKEKTDKDVVLNPRTGRLVSASSAIGRKLLNAMKPPRVPKVKAPKAPRVPKVKAPISLVATKPIPEGSMYNPFTGRMVKLTSQAGKFLLSAMSGEDLNTPKPRGRPKKAPKPRKEVSMTYEGTVKNLKRRISNAKKATTKARLQSQLDMMLAS